MGRGKTYDVHTPNISLRGLYKGQLLRAPQVRKLAGLVSGEWQVIRYAAGEMKAREKLFSQRMEDTYEN